MWIESIEKPFHVLRYLNAKRGGGSEWQNLWFYKAKTTLLPRGCKAIACMSDLQGVVPLEHQRNQLLGIAAAHELVALCKDRVLPSPASMGIVLAGDLFSVTDATKRGGYGPVREVWEAFSSFRWVLGVAGNHDEISETDVRDRTSVYLLDGECASVDGHRFGGVGRVVGYSKREPDSKRALDEQQFRIEYMLDGCPDTIVLHEGPELNDEQRGNHLLNPYLFRGSASLIVCGHCYWNNPFGVAENNTQVLNVDGRVVVLCSAN